MTDISYIVMSKIHQIKKKDIIKIKHSEFIFIFMNWSQQCGYFNTVIIIMIIIINLIEPFQVGMVNLPIYSFTPIPPHL